MLVITEGCPYPRCYNCPRRAFQTLPTSPLSSILQLLTSHPGKINGLTMHNMECHSPLTDIDGHSKTLVQMMMRRLATRQTHDYSELLSEPGSCHLRSYGNRLVNSGDSVFLHGLKFQSDPFHRAEELDLLKHLCDLCKCTVLMETAHSLKETRLWGVWRTQSLWEGQRPFPLESHGNQLWCWTRA